MKIVKNQADLDAAILGGDQELKIVGEWEKCLIGENADIESVYVSGTVKGSVDVSGTVKGGVYVSGTVKGSVYVSGTVKGSVHVYGTANVGSVHVSGTAKGGVHVSGTANVGSVDVYGTAKGGVHVSGTANVGSVHVSGTANVGSVDVYGTANVGSVDVYGTLGKIGRKNKRISGFTFEEIEADHRKVLEAAPLEVPELLKALNKGKINGHLYDGNCRCLVGTLEKARGKGEGCIIPRQSSRPAEKFYLGIGEGHTPKNNSFSKFAAQWCEEFLAEIKEAKK